MSLSGADTGILKNIIVGVNNSYKIDTKRIIGRGAFSTVYTGSNVDSKIRVAIKKICKLEKHYECVVDSEMKIVTLMINDTRYQHPNIVRYFDTIRIKGLLYIIMEYCSDGMFSSLLVKPIKEFYAKYYFKQLMEALKVLHDMRIVHRDIKPENILLTDNYKTIKVCDFGFSHITYDDANGTENTSLKKIVYGSPIYMAPENFRSDPINSNIDSNIDSSADMWSAGMILHELLYGYHPCKGSKDIHDMRRRTADRINIGVDSHNITISRDATDILKGMLDCDSKLRTSADKIINSRWIQSCRSEDVTKIVLSELFNININIKKNEISLSHSLPCSFTTSNDIKLAKKQSLDDTYCGTGSDKKIRKRQLSNTTKTIINDGSFDLLMQELSGSCSSSVSNSTNGSLNSSLDNMPKYSSSDIFIMDPIDHPSNRL